ncbi:MAG: hypothetical protein OSJ73_26170, partial [Lachnospiraceae bacterium]|nr:hypothetical protein [Lachnospiraceae bacterium]
LTKKLKKCISFSFMRLICSKYNILLRHFYAQIFYLSVMFVITAVIKFDSGLVFYANILYSV